MRRHLLILAFGSCVLASATAFAAPPIPPLPGAGGTTAPVPGGGTTIDFEQLRKGVVQVEQGGRPMAVGTVLQKDGRVITSLSALGGVENPEIRYSDNSVVKTKIGHKDKNWDLALLVPQTGKWLDGLMPTDIDPSGIDLKAFLPKAGTGKLAGFGIPLKGKTDARSKEGNQLPGVLDIDLKGLPGIPGAPLIDSTTGKVVGLMVRACKDNPAFDAQPENGKPVAVQCTPITIGAPVTALRSFLMKVPTTAVQPAAWLGLGGAPTESGNVKGVRVMGVAPGSPAEKAGLKSGGDNPDTIVAVDGQPVETPEQLADVISKRAIGQTVKLLVFSQGKFREAVVTLKAAP